MSLIQTKEIKTTQQYPILIVLIIAMLAVAPIFASKYPPCVDIPQHAAQIALFKGIISSSNPFGYLFSIHWFTPYLFGYGLIAIFNIFFSIILATKITIALSLLLIPYTTALLLAENDSEPYYALFTIPALYGFLFNWGFLNFIVAAPIGLIFFLYTIKYTKYPTNKTAIIIAASANILFFCHALIWFYFATISSIYIAMTFKKINTALVKTIPILSSLPIAVFWFINNILTRKEQTHGMGHAIIWNQGLARLDIFPLIFGSQELVPNLAISACIIALPMLMGGRFTKKPTRWLPLITTLLIILFAPHAIFDVAFIYQRYAIFVVPFLLLTLDKPITKPKNFNAAKMASAAFIILTTVNQYFIMSGFKNETRDFDLTLKHMQPAQRVLSLIFMRNSYFSSAPVYLHFPLWYQAQKNGLVEYNFANSYIMPLQYKENNVPANVPGREWSPQLFDWNTLHGEQYEYFLIRSPINPGLYVFKNNINKVILLNHSGTWWLFEKNKAIYSN